MPREAILFVSGTTRKIFNEFIQELSPLPLEFKCRQKGTDLSDSAFVYIDEEEIHFAVVSSNTIWLSGSSMDDLL